MGPRFFNRGNVTSMDHEPEPVPPASMGPRFFNRGNIAEFAGDEERDFGFNGAAVFQPRK